MSDKQNFVAMVGAFLLRLGGNTRGNTFMLVAAAMIPLIGLIGGGVDMSRMYLTKTRLQHACDAGALAGRKAMGSLAWSTTSENAANAMFDGNFQQNDYGTGARTRSFAESDGSVSGTVSAVVPMTVMRALGFSSQTINVNCTAKLAIPNTDVMFVLDVTGSMNCTTTSTTCTNNGNVPATNAKITGLKQAVKCFYEALMKVNTTQVCGNDPVATTYNGTAQIRIGFVPYSVNVNVGKLLPTSYFPDTWTYQSRIATNPATVQTWTVGPQNGWSGWSNYSPATMPTTYNTANGIDSDNSDWVTPDTNVTFNGTFYYRSITGRNSSSCAATNTANTLANSNNTLIARSDVAGTTPDPVSSAPPPNYPDEVQIITNTQTEPHTVTGLRYRWKKVDGSNNCWLEYARATYNRTRTQTATKTVTWNPIRVFTSWDYKPVTVNISGLKKADGTWNDPATVSLPDVDYTTLPGTYKPSGSDTAYTYSTPADRNVTWDGCVEERATVMNSDRTPEGEWDPIPTAALDLNIDMIPSGSAPAAGLGGSYWGPMLKNTVWARYDGTYTCGRYTCTNDTRNTVTTSSNLDQNSDYYCTTAAKKLQSWSTANPFETYVDSLRAIGNTYHDIGMIWGARFISPTGIFAEENTNLTRIERHIIFMTDGDTQTALANYSAYGVNWWDKRQTTYSPSADDLDNVLNARLSALCTAIKNKNITLWVISYGGGINTDTESRLTACATSGKYFSASNTSSLISRFQQIASDISELRLTN